MCLHCYNTCTPCVPSMSFTVMKCGLYFEDNCDQTFTLSGLGRMPSTVHDKTFIPAAFGAGCGYSWRPTIRNVFEFYKACACSSNWYAACNARHTCYVPAVPHFPAVISAFVASTCDPWCVKILPLTGKHATFMDIDQHDNFRSSWIGNNCSSSHQGVGCATSDLQAEYIAVHTAPATRR